MTPEEIMEAGMLLMKKKAQDYTTNQESNRYENFERQAQLLAWFKHPQDQAFVGVIAIKLARLAALLNSDREPNNESIADSFTDLTNYCALWGGSRTTTRDDAVAKLNQLAEAGWLDKPVPYKPKRPCYFCNDETIDEARLVVNKANDVAHQSCFDTVSPIRKSKFYG